MQSESRVLIAGYGQMGRAFETLLKGRATLEIWEVAPGRTEVSAALRDFAARTDFLCLCIPTLAHAAVLAAMTDHLAPSSGMLSIAKGLDASGRNAAEILAAQCGRSFGVLGGPMIADEIVAGRAAYAELGSADAGLAARVSRLFDPRQLQLSHSPHAAAVSWCGVLKNVYAPLIGISDELRWGDNARGHLIAMALHEMRKLVTHFTGRSDVYGDAGLADFVTTVTSASSHHYRLGRLVARGERPLPECEGLNSLRVLEAQRRVPQPHFPLYALLAGLLTEAARVPIALQAWLGTGH